MDSLVLLVSLKHEVLTANFSSLARKVERDKCVEYALVYVRDVILCLGMYELVECPLVIVTCSAKLRFNEYVHILLEMHTC